MPSTEIHGAVDWAAITPSDSANIPDNYGRPVRAIWSGSGGNVALVSFDDSVAVLTLAAGQVYDFQVKRVNATSTTATGLWALY